jgi:hypothetical protein
MTEEVKKEENKPEDLTVDAYGIVIKCSTKEEKEKLIAARDAEKSKTKDALAKISAAEAAKAEAEAKAKKEAERAAAIEAAKNGDIDKLKAEWEAPWRAKFDSLTSNYVKEKLQATVAGRGDVAPTSIADVVEALSFKNKFTLNDKGEIAAEDGKAFKDIVDGYLKERPHLIIAKVPAGTGAQKAGVNQAPAKEDNIRPEARAAGFMEKLGDQTV